MAIYDAGTASLAADGTVTGVGTTWRQPLTLIRVGATMIFNTTPASIVTIAEIISDTEIRVFNDKGFTAPAGTQYSILAHDGITVQGLAQDVAETLRYYQSNNYVTADENGNVEIQNGGTGASSAPDARANLGLGSAATFDTVPVANGGTGANNASDARDNLGLGPLSTSNVAPIENGGTGVTTREELWPIVRPFDVYGNVGRRMGLPDGITRNHITMWNSADTPSAGFMNYLEGGWFNGAWRIGGIRGGGQDLAACQLTVDSGQGMNYDYVFNNNGTASAANWVSTSDRRVKKDIVEIADPLTKMRSIRGVSWTMRFKNNPLKGFGFVAQEVQKYFPDAVSVVNKNPMTLEDDTVVEGVMSVDTSGVSAALHHEAILTLMDKIEVLESRISSLEAGGK
ncbi:winged helix-turn-helix DNA-binding domain-containing protein [Shigella phage Sf12]|uniref:Winged helix-turn-helix DNA-binding domain-containing protein n=1 Tax=Shigella phage Sf12 TaxID=2024315 RepID=A0A291AXP5_9CAUD|nr:tail fiber protein [Shigella phage Sf12]ATE85753.1 winged helix-turn-helix DNA-binding domain-containing protein [Shigella phage Sf12]